MANNGQHDFIEFVCKPVEDLYVASGERIMVRISKGTEYRCSMLRDQHFASLFRHYAKHNGVDKETLVFFFTEELMQPLEPSDTPRLVHLRKNDVIVIRHRRKPETDGMCVRLDLVAEDALGLIAAFPRARSLASADGRTPLHQVAARGTDPNIATKLLLLGCDPQTKDNYGRTAWDIADYHQHTTLANVLSPHEFKRQMAVIRAHFVGISGKNNMSLTAATDEDRPGLGLMKRHCADSSSATPGGNLSQKEKHDAAVRFLFSKLAHGNQARNFKRVVCFLYA